MCHQSTSSCVECLHFAVKLRTCTANLGRVQPVLLGPDSEDNVCWAATNNTHLLVVCDNCYAKAAKACPKSSIDFCLLYGVFDQAKIDHAVHELANKGIGNQFVNVTKVLANHQNDDIRQGSEESSPNPDCSSRYLVPVNVRLIS